MANGLAWHGYPMAVVLLALGGCSHGITTDANPANGSNVATEYPNLHGVVHANDEFVAVGSDGVIVTSSDGQSWNPQDSGSSADLFGVSYGASQFVAVGTEGTILTSPDGTSWTTQTSTTSSVLQAVAFGNDLFVAVGRDLTILTSSDGITWTEVYSGNGVWQDLTFTGSQFIAVNRVGGVILSPDAITWTLSVAGNTVNDVGLCGVGAGPGAGAIALGYDGAVKLSTDSALTAFTVEANLSADFDLVVTEGCDVLALDDTFVVTLGGGVEASTDGTTWTPMPVGEQVEALASDGAHLVGVGAAGTVLNATCTAGVCSDPSVSVIEVPVPSTPGNGSGGTSTGSCAGQCDSTGACGPCASTADCCSGAVCISGAYCSKNSVASGCECNQLTAAGVCADFADSGFPEITSCGGLGSAACNTQTSWCCPGLVAVQNGAACSCEDPNSSGYECSGQ